MNVWFGRWSVVGGFYGRCGRWSVVGGRCFAFFLVGGRLLFSRMVGGRCLNQYMVGGRWLMVDGRWSVVGGWSVAGGFVLRRGDSYLLFMLCQSSLLSTVISLNTKTSCGSMKACQLSSAWKILEKNSFISPPH